MREYTITFTKNAIDYDKMMCGYNGFFTREVTIEAENKAQAKANAPYVIPKKAVIVNIKEVKN